MSHALYKLGRFAARRPWAVIGSWLMVAVIVVGASSAFGRELTDSFDVPGLDSQEAIDLLAAANSEQAGLTAQVVVTPLKSTDSFFDSAAAQEDLLELQTELAALPNVVSTSDPAGSLAAGLAAAGESGSISPAGRVALVRLQYAAGDEVGASDLDELKELVVEARIGSSLQIEMAGQLFFEFEEAESGIGEMAGVILAAVILLVAFGSLIAMGLPMGMALFGLAIGVSSMSLITYLIDIPSWAPQMASMIGLGVGIDYALFLVTRHRENLAMGMDVEESIGRSVATAGQAVIFAGGTVVIAILGLALAGVPFMTAAGVATSVVVLIMVLASVTLLPAFLGVSGSWINRLGIHRKSTKPATAEPSLGAGWLRWGQHVSRNAWAYAVGVTVLLLALASPVLAMRLGTADDGTKPESRTERRAYDLVAEGFGPGINGPLVIAVDISEDAAIVGPLFDAILADDGIASTAPAAINVEAGVATMLAFPTTSPQDRENSRHDPTATRRRLPVGARRQSSSGSHRRSDGHRGRYRKPGQQSFAAVHHRGARFVVPVADDGVPLGARAAQGRIAQPTQHRCRLWRVGDGVSMGLGCRSYRPRVDRPNRSRSSRCSCSQYCSDSRWDYEVFLLSRVREGVHGDRRQRCIGHPGHS